MKLLTAGMIISAFLAGFFISKMPIPTPVKHIDWPEEMPLAKTGDKLVGQMSGDTLYLGFDNALKH